MKVIFGLVASFLLILSPASAALLEYSFTTTGSNPTGTSGVKDPAFASRFTATSFAGTGNQAGFAGVRMNAPNISTGRYQTNSTLNDMWSTSNGAAASSTTATHRTVDNSFSPTFNPTNSSGFRVDVSNALTLTSLEFTGGSDSNFSTGGTRALNLQVWYRVNGTGPAVKIFSRAEDQWTVDEETGARTYNSIKDRTAFSTPTGGAAVGRTLVAGDYVEFFFVGSKMSSGLVTNEQSNAVTGSFSATSYDFDIIRLNGVAAVVPEPTSLAIFGLLGCGIAARRLRRIG